MSYFQKGLLLILLTATGLVGFVAHADTTPYLNESNNSANNFDYSTSLQAFLEKKSAELHDKSYLFNIEKQGDTYKVQMQHNNETIVKTIPKATVDNFFRNNINSSGEEILNIINIGGKK